MPNPKTLRIGDKIKFIERPDEWKAPGFIIFPECTEFMDQLIKQTLICTIQEIDEFGQPWIHANVETSDTEEHTWAIMEQTGWIKVH